MDFIVTPLISASRGHEYVMATRIARLCKMKEDFVQGHVIETMVGVLSPVGKLRMDHDVLAKKVTGKSLLDFRAFHVGIFIAMEQRILER